MFLIEFSLVSIYVNFINRSKNTIRLAIIDDNPIDIDNLENHLHHYFSDGCTIDSFSDGESFLKKDILSYDMLFIDVEMPTMDGFTLASRIREISSDIILVFVTNMAQLARQGYKYNAFDYLPKPVEYVELSMTLDRAVLKDKKEEGDKIILLPDKNKNKVPLSVSEINYIEVQGHYITFHTTRGNFEQYGVLKKILEETNLPSSFIRCHQSYVVNLLKIDQIFKDKLIVAGDTLSISRPQRKQFFDSYTNYISGRRKT